MSQYEHLDGYNINQDPTQYKPFSWEGREDEGKPPTIDEVIAYKKGEGSLLSNYQAFELLSVAYQDFYGPIEGSIQGLRNSATEYVIEWDLIPSDVLKVHPLLKDLKNSGEKKDPKIPNNLLVLSREYVFQATPSTVQLGAPKFYSYQKLEGYLGKLSLVFAGRACFALDKTRGVICFIVKSDNGNDRLVVDYSKIEQPKLVKDYSGN